MVSYSGLYSRLLKLSADQKNTDNVAMDTASMGTYTAVFDPDMVVKATDGGDNGDAAIIGDLVKDNVAVMDTTGVAIDTNATSRDDGDIEPAGDQSQQIKPGSEVREEMTQGQVLTYRIRLVSYHGNHAVVMTT